MAGLKNQVLLGDERVKEEISRHRWIESEKAGQDIGFDKAAQDWLERFSDDWMKANQAKRKTAGKSAKRI